MIESLERKNKQLGPGFPKVDDDDPFNFSRGHRTSFVSPSGDEVAQIASSDISNLRFGSPEVRIANVKSYTDSITKPYAPDPIDRIIKDTKFPSPTYTTSSGDVWTKKPYTESTPGFKYFNV